MTPWTIARWWPCRAIPGRCSEIATPGALEEARLAGAARLRLLDPDRYADLDAFLREAEHFREVANLAGKLLAGTLPTPDEVELLADVLKTDAAALAGQCARAQAGDSAAREVLLRQLVDQHGPGRVMFRNTRAAMPGFPARVVHLLPLPAPTEPERHFERLADEFAADTAPESEFDPEFRDDPRVAWLADFLRRNPDEKVLLLCRTEAKVLALDAALRRAGVFPPLLVYLAASGESAGRLDTMLERAADYLEREFDSFTSAALAMLEPVIIILMGGIVAVIILSILLPILQLQSLTGA